MQTHHHEFRLTRMCRVLQMSRSGFYAWEGRLSSAWTEANSNSPNGYASFISRPAKEAERGVEAACLARFGTLRPVGAPVLRSDNGLIFQGLRFRQVAYRDH